MERNNNNNNHAKGKTSAPIGVCSCNFLPFKEVMSYRPTNRPTTPHDKLADKLFLLFVVPLKSNLSSLVGERG